MAGAVVLELSDTLIQFAVGGCIWAGFTGLSEVFEKLRGRPFVLGSLIEHASRTLFLALAFYSVFVIAESRILLIRFAVTTSFAPRAVDVLTWSVFILFFFTQTFGSRLIPGVMMLYGFEELLWNPEFNVGHIGDPALVYLSSPQWQLFFVAMIGILVVGFLLSQKAFTFWWSWWSLIPIAYMVVDFAFGMPVGASIAQTLSQPWNPFNYSWEFLWALSYLSFVKLNLRERIRNETAEGE